jgi:hypothetical protein
MLSIMRGGKGRDLENIVARSQPSYSRPSGSSLPSNVAYNSDWNSGPSFFERLFGAPTPAAPVRGQRTRRVVR